jgi:hypothetical protein
VVFVTNLLILPVPFLPGRNSGCQSALNWLNAATDTAAKACKGHWVNKFGHWPVRTAPRRSYVFPAAVNVSFHLTISTAAAIM